jgi:GNAT superfamily N-acetyltransferase
MAQVLADRSSVVAVGTVDGAPVAYGLMSVTEAADGSIHAFIEELFVELEARSVGVGESLADLLLGIAAERGARWVDSLALPGDRATKNFFESRGMVARAIIVSREVGDR